jgi:hypothetical protein
VTLDQIWIRLRLEMLKLADGSTGSYDADNGGHTKPGSRAPKPAGDDIKHFEARWQRAKAHRSKRAILLCRDCADPKARVGGAVRCCVIGYLRSYLLTKPDPSKRRGTQEWRKAIARDSRPHRAVARSYGVKRNTVLACRAEFDMKVPVGRPKREMVPRVR